jgi:hypothetical protein
MEDASLSDFLGTGEEPADSGDEGMDTSEDQTESTGEPETSTEDGHESADDIPSLADQTRAEPDVPAVEAASVDPATPTATWRPGSEPCPCCGEAVGWRWRGEDGTFVCRDCAAWDRV